MIPTGLDSASSTGIAIRLNSLISRATSGYVGLGRDARGEVVDQLGDLLSAAGPYQLRQRQRVDQLAGIVDHAHDRETVVSAAGDTKSGFIIPPAVEGLKLGLVLVVELLVRGGHDQIGDLRRMHAEDAPRRELRPRCREPVGRHEQLNDAGHRSRRRTVPPPGSALENPRREHGGVAGVVHPDARHRHAGRHLRDRQQRVESAGDRRAAGQRNPDHRQVGVGRDHAG
jgi:hypothetical protein